MALAVRSLGSTASTATFTLDALHQILYLEMTGFPSWMVVNESNPALSTRRLAKVSFGRPETLGGVARTPLSKPTYFYHSPVAAPRPNQYLTQARVSSMMTGVTVAVYELYGTP